MYNNDMEKEIYLAGGCFWGVEAYYQLLDGITYTNVGYANGSKENPTYEEVCSGVYKHVEAVKIKYDTNIISLEKILEHFLRFVNPYSLNRQGNDIGVQYRSGIYFTNQDDFLIIKNYLEKQVGKTHKIEILPLDNYYEAEKYHQSYLIKNPSGYCHVNLNLVKPNEKKVR